MTTTAINKEIAKFCGYHVIESPKEDGTTFYSLHTPKRRFHYPRNDTIEQAWAWADARYCSDLNEIHTAIMQLSDVEYKNKDGFLWSDRCEFMCQLERIVLRDTKVDRCNFEFYNATARQRCEALLRTIGKWKE